MAIPNINGATKEELTKILEGVNVVPDPTLAAMRDQARAYNRKFKQTTDATSDHEDVDNQVSNKTTNIVNNYYTNNVQSPTIHNWGVKFSGSSDIRDFVLRVEELARCRRIELSFVVTAFPDLLEGRALSWFRTIFKETLTWPELKGLLLQRFDKNANQTEALKALLTMKQQYNQSVVDYVEDVQLANLRLNLPLPEDQITDLVCNSLLPKYAVVIAYFDDKNIESLVNVCKRFERSLTLSDGSDSKANDFKKTTSFKPYRQNNSSSTSTATSTLTSSTSTPFNKSKFRCSFCNAQGHTKPFCRKWKSESQRNSDKRRDDSARTNPKN